MYLGYLCLGLSSFGKNLYNQKIFTKLWFSTQISQQKKLLLSDWSGSSFNSQLFLQSINSCRKITLEAINSLLKFTYLKEFVIISSLSHKNLKFDVEYQIGEIQILTVQDSNNFKVCCLIIKLEILRFFQRSQSHWAERFVFSWKNAFWNPSGLFWYNRWRFWR